MSQQWLNSHLTLHIHKENTCTLTPNLADIGNDFISAKEKQNDYVW